MPVYAVPSRGELYSPFNIKVNPMEKLFLIGFEKDPDEVYIGLEPQWFSNEAYGIGIRVIAWRKDGYVDVYQQPGLPLERNFDVAAKGLADLIQRPMENAKLVVSENGVDVCFTFKDKTGRHIEVEITEKSQKPTKPFTILAPVGSSSVTPSSLPVYFLHDFCFVRRAHTVVNICIDGRRHKPDTFPLPLDGSRVYFMRYSGDTLLVDWCVAQSGPMSPLIGEGDAWVDSSKVIYDFVETDGHKEIRRMRTMHSHHHVSVDFTPPFPEITCLRDKVVVDGHFVISGDESAGEVSGTYRVSRCDDEVQVTMNPHGGWNPRPKTLFLKMLFRVAKIFRNWPKTYQWTAKVKLNGAGAPSLESRWNRI